MAGLAVLLAAVLGAAVLLTRLTLTWSRSRRADRDSLAAHDIETSEAPQQGEHEWTESSTR